MKGNGRLAKVKVAICMDDVDYYLGPDTGNVDILVQFIKKSSQPSEIRNVDPDAFSRYNAQCEPVTEPVVEPTTEPAPKPTPESVVEPTFEPVFELANHYFCPDETYVSDEDVMFNGCLSESSDSDYDLNEEEDEFGTYESDDLSDFEESLDVIGNDHSDEDIIEIYVERGILGKPYENQRDGRITLEKHQLFLNVNHFREVLKDFAIQEGFELKRVKNEKVRVTCECASEGCRWRIHASPTSDGVTYKIKTYQGIHTCIRTSKNSDANSTWNANKLQSILMADPNIRYSSMRQTLLERHGIEPTNLMQLYRAKRKVHQHTGGVHALSYNDLPTWAEVVRQTNPGSTVKLAVEPRVGLNPQFKRIFVCLDAMKKGFVRGCRPWFGIDGYHLKGPFGGVLLSAVGLYGNKDMFPIAVAVVEVECKDSWLFFLTLLHEALQSVLEWKDNFLYIMSDQQKGLIQAVAEIFPYAKHRFCCNHLLNHFKMRFRSMLLTSHFWSCAMAYNEFMFDKAMTAMRKVSNEVADWLLCEERPKHTWARHTYHPLFKSDHVTNNVCEVFNSWLGDDRRKTILCMLESIVCRLMVIYQKRYQQSVTTQYVMTTRVRKILDITNQDARFLVVTYAGCNILNS